MESQSCTQRFAEDDEEEPLAKERRVCFPALTTLCLPRNQLNEQALAVLAEAAAPPSSRGVLRPHLSSARARVRGAPRVSV